MSSHRINSGLQQAFAKLSGDFNPMHVDPIAARRLISGRPVVHGIHSILWALDSWLEIRQEKVSLVSLEAEFRKPVDLGNEICCAILSEEGGKLELELSSTAIAATLYCQWVAGESTTTVIPISGMPERRESIEHTGEKLHNLSGALELLLDTDAAEKLFPSLIAWLPHIQIAEILATSRLVGMECPGLHSVFSELKLSFSELEDDTPVLKFHVKRFDERFGLTTVEVRGPGVTGAIKAFLRPIPQDQISYGVALESIEQDEFSGQRALIIGGSRGLGEVSAKLLAAGGAEVLLTYHQGADDAHRVTEEIRLGNGSAEALPFDITDGGKSFDLILSQSILPTHLYYYATPHIFSGDRGVFSVTLFEEFCTYYVKGFIDLTRPMIESGLRSIFYPSSIALEQLPPDMVEYTAAKAAGEVICAFLETLEEGVFVYRPRLPRLATDQTLSLLPVHNNAPAPEILNHLRSFRNFDGAR
jgi:hypothetical protein